MGVAACTPEGRGSLAYVFYARIVDVAQATRKDTASILGHVLAHEMGHLLLPANAHSRSGVMRANWNSQQMERAVNGLLQFTPEQGELIRNNVSSVHSPS